MKNLCIAIILITSSTLFAQNMKMTNPAVVSGNYLYNRPANEMTLLVGFTSNAANLGFDYAHMIEGVGYGGYFLLQTEKKPAITQIMTLGGLLKFNIAEKNKFTATLSPGFGLHQYKDIGTSDESALGLVFKIAAQYKLTPEFNLGIESTTITNMFSDKAPSQSQVYSLAGTFGF